jgi:hypothetical protein
MELARQRDDSSRLEQLVLPPVKRQELTVVGGGLSSLVFATQLLYGSGPVSDGEKERLLRLSSLPNRQLDSVCMLSAGASIAYEGARGPFSRFLTLSGSDQRERRVEIERMRARTKAEFSERGFSYCEGTTVTSVARLSSGAYRLQVRGNYGGGIVETDKLALAVGHSLREVPSALKKYVIQGAGALCQKLDSAQSGEISDQECLARILGRYSPAPNASLRIALVGVGMSFVEVVKILENLLEKPRSAHGKYTLIGSGIPVELVVYSPRLSTVSGSWQELAVAVQKGLEELPPISDGIDADRAEDESRDYKQSSVARIRKLGEAGQIVLVPRLFDWNSAYPQGGLVHYQADLCGPDKLSCIIDCAPFVEGLTAQQAEIVRTLDDVELVRVTRSQWSATCKPVARHRLALLGAAFTPRSKWNEMTWRDQATKAIVGFYPPENAV